MTHIAVIGRGLIGSAAARHLALAGHQVTLIGPVEPDDKTTHEGIFGSHYDEGRITRALDQTVYWSAITQASIARYAQIEAQSGIAFFTDCGGMMLGPKGSDFVRNVTHVQKANHIACKEYAGTDLETAFPFFCFERDAQAFYEANGAGYINPRKLVKAQSVAAIRAGATWVEATALAITENSNSVLISTDKGEVMADQVLVAAGGFSNMVLPQPLSVQIYARTVSFFEVSEEEAARLANMPTLVMRFADGRDPYLLPPIRYPNGKIYLKLGCELADVPLDTVEELKAWFKGIGTAEVGAYQQAIMMELMPDLRVEAAHTEACMTTFTADNRPVISRQSDRITVAVAGCGRGAKCCDELGRIGAELASLR
ncbi:MAG: FAD-dependent oxidoreductase [Amylibacter sp.]|nr:FAD-dependent oxidoreductase [Amylibacter sp.]